MASSEAQALSLTVGTLALEVLPEAVSILKEPFEALFLDFYMCIGLTDASIHEIFAAMPLGTIARCFCFDLFDFAGLPDAFSEMLWWPLRLGVVLNSGGRACAKCASWTSTSGAS